MRSCESLHERIFKVYIKVGRVSQKKFFVTAWLFFSKILKGRSAREENFLQKVSRSRTIKIYKKTNYAILRMK